VLRQRIVDVPAGAGLVLAFAPTLGEIDGGARADPLQTHLAHDLRIDDRGSHGACSRATLVPARGPARGRCSEEEVAHRAAAARGARDLGEDREPDRQPEAQHERQRDRQRREARSRYEHSARRR
jgi:hypothetical protein